LEELVREWQLYEAGKKYNNSIKCINNANYYDLTEALVDFVNGNQWRNLEVTGMRKPVFNIMHKALRFWVASITANNTKIDLEPLEYSQTEQTDEMDIAGFASSEIANLFEKFKMDNRIREALTKAGTIGDVAAHLYFDPTKKPYGGAFHDVEGEICFELVSGTNVFFGNANNANVEEQPYIIIAGRDLVKNLKEEAARYMAETEDITEEKDYTTDEIEVEADGYGKATYIIVYKRTKETVPVTDELGEPVLDEIGQPVTEEKTTIKVTKCVKNAYIYKDVDTGLTHYPVAWLPWDRQESQYHGRPPLAEAMETQIFINLMFAMMMFHLSMTAFPKAVYDADKINNWTNKIAEAIPVRNLNAGESIKNIAGYLEPAQMSPQLVQVIQMAYDMTKDLLGVNEAALGEINPEEASGRAILATVKQSTIPLENTKANMYEWIEDIGIILLDMMGTYYGYRPIVREQDGQRHVEWFDFSQLKNIYLNVRVDVGTTNIWSDQARKQALDNLFIAGKIDIIQYLERLDDSDIPDRQGLIDEIKQTMTDQQFIQGMIDQYVQALPMDVQAQLAELQQKNPQQYEQTVRQMMGGAAA
jgi:hypothetical protein